MKKGPFKQKAFSGFGKIPKSISKKDPAPNSPSFNRTPNLPKPPNPNVKFFRTNPFSNNLYNKANEKFTKTKRK